MNNVYAFFKKEMLEGIRTGRLPLLLVIFLLFGLMNPALAKLTPWLLKLMENSLAQGGIILGEIEVTAINSWEQFYKNISTAFIVFLIMFANILANEYRRGTLTPLLTKGLKKTSVYAAKYINVFLTWTLCFWLYFSVTSLYNNFYWGQADIPNIFIGAFMWWLLGILFISLQLLLAIIFPAATTVILFLGLANLLSYLLMFLPQLKNIMPNRLAHGLMLLKGVAMPSDIVPAIISTAILIGLIVTASHRIIKNKII